jgi:hypothetical protein
MCFGNCWRCMFTVGFLTDRPPPAYGRQTRKQVQGNRVCASSRCGLVVRGFLRTTFCIAKLTGLLVTPHMILT